MRDLLDLSSGGASTAELGEDDSDEEGGFQVKFIVIFGSSHLEFLYVFS